MNTVLRALILFILLAVLALLLGTVAQGPLPVVVQVAGLTIQTTAPIAVIGVLAAFMLAFYLGRLTGWMLRLPRSWFRRKQAEVSARVADAYAAASMGNATLAQQLLTDLKPEDPALADLATILALQTSPLPAFSEKTLANPRLAALTALTYARVTAAAANWEETLRLATIGRQHAPQNAYLLTLQFKALVNLNNPDASELLPTLKPLLGTARHKLLVQIIQGPTALTARPTLDSAWVRAFQQWLPTGSDIFPA
ncbi:MAG: heme biosynthesis protein HemY [Rubrivivax sp.]|nr:MAG: heme biosynthesis protein HemY [Rubrivivax sp.]